ncbi:MAG: hypothetical protein U5Q03_04645 [Bacteroidota bacterium]|nr:hypothetical protein [Bacteroidota bacterium]
MKIKERITAFKGMEVELSDNDKFEFSLYLGEALKPMTVKQNITLTQL